MHGLVRVSEAASLGLHAAAVIAGHGGDPVSVGQIADLLGASEAHLAKVLNGLSKAGLVDGRPGPGGGFTLTRPAGDISLGDVYEAIEGPIETSPCLFDLPICDSGKCPLSRLLAGLNGEVARELAAATLDDFKVPRRKKARRS